MTKGLTHYPIDVYGTELHVATSLKAWAKLRKQVDSIEEDPESLGLTVITVARDDAGAPTPHLAIYIDADAHGDDELRLINTCAHEAAHAAGFLLHQIGEQYDGASEAHAYLVGAIAATLWRAVVRR